MTMCVGYRIFIFGKVAFVLTQHSFTISTNTPMTYCYDLLNLAYWKHIDEKCKHKNCLALLSLLTLLKLFIFKRHSKKLFRDLFQTVYIELCVQVPNLLLENICGFRQTTTLT